MNKLYIVTVFSFCTLAAQAQFPEDALRLSWNPMSGTARSMAIGGALTGLGGEITAAHTNPGGLALYKTSEFVLSPGFNFGKNKTEYRGTKNNGEQASGFNMGTTGVILAGGFGNNNAMRGAALSFTVNKVADFNSNITYKGFNNNSSGAERYSEEFSASRQSIDDALNNPFLSAATRLAIYTYLVDTMTLNGIKQVIAMPQFTNGVNQENTISSSGGINEYAFSAAINSKDKLFIGGTLGLPYVNLNRDQTYKESDASTVNNNRFASYEYTESLRTRGLGLNVKLGFIYRPVERVRFGLAIHSPSFFQLRDRVTASMTANTENYKGIRSATSADLSVERESEIATRYSFQSPWRVAGGISYVFREVENVKKQRAFISADIEYITYRSMRYSSQEENPTQDEQDHFEGISQGIKNIYKNAFNFRLGGEIKFNTLMFRLGGAYMGNPNKQSADLKSNRIMVSGGLGYRHKGVFVDLAYVHQMQRDVNFPYRLDDKPNTFADIRGTTGTVMVTAGFKF